MVGGDNVIRAFSAGHVVRLTGLTKRQLTYWDKTGFFAPQYAFENRRSPYSRIYSFRDVVGLRIVSVLRNKFDVPLQHLRKVAKVLSGKDYAFWGREILYVVNGEVAFHEPETGRVRGVVSEQFVEELPLEKVIGDVAEEAARLKQRSPEQIGKVERHLHVAHYAWVLAGTRIRTGAIKRFKDEGYSVKAILREYPSLTKADVVAALTHEEKLARICRKTARLRRTAA